MVTRVLLLLMIAAGSLRIVSTYSVFSNTIDEPAHIASGLEWLDRHQWTMETLHPPLARVLTAIGPWIRGERSHPEAGIWSDGFRILGSGAHYDQTLALARLGILPLFWIASLAVYAWGRRLTSRRGALIAVLLFTSTPPILGHAGMATTDFALVTFTTTSIVAGIWFLDAASALRAAILGLSIGLAIASKFSALVFLPPILLSVWLWHDWRGGLRAARWIPTILLVAFVTVWAWYRFSVARDPVLGFSVPFPELFNGLRMLQARNGALSPDYLCGMCRTAGFWYYFPAVLAFKTPLGLLAILIVGIWLSVSRRWKAMVSPLLVAGSILLIASFSHIQIGVRHVLPVYAAVAVAGGLALEFVLESRSRILIAVCALLTIWHLASGALAHPDYLAYTNELTWPKPENFVVDSDLDWDQDLKRLAIRARELGIQKIHYRQFGGGYFLAGNAFPKILPSDLHHPSPGWNAVSVTILKLDCFFNKGYKHSADLWPEHIPPREKIGKTIYLYYLPEN